MHIRIEITLNFIYNSKKLFKSSFYYLFTVNDVFDDQYRVFVYFEIVLSILIISHGSRERQKSTVVILETLFWERFLCVTHSRSVLFHI